jgi:hypothetical protein
MRVHCFDSLICPHDRKYFVVDLSGLRRLLSNRFIYFSIALARLAAACSAASSVPRIVAVVTIIVAGQKAKGRVAPRSYGLDGIVKILFRLTILI